MSEQFRKLKLLDKIRENLNSPMSDRKELTILLIYFLVKKNEYMQQDFVLDDFV